MKLVVIVCSQYIVYLQYLQMLAGPIPAYIGE